MSFECDRCGVTVEFDHFEYETFEGHKLKKEIMKCPTCGELFIGEESLA